MHPLIWLAAIILFMHLPIPLYWFVIHPKVGFWRRHQKAGYITGVLCSYLLVAPCLVLYRHDLFRDTWPPFWSAAAGLLLVVLEGWIFWRVKRDLGVARLIGKTELSGRGEIAREGIYAWIRHPRYVGSFIAIVGACFLAGERAMWIVAAVWCVMALGAIALEERELRTRFGADYEEYCRRVPRFLPVGARLREG